jgi:hypothetical protein
MCPLKGSALRAQRREVTSQVVVPCASSALHATSIAGKLDVLNVQCTKCARKGRYSARRLIEKYGRKANMMKWKEQLNGDCPKRDAHSMHEHCDLVCPDLPNVLWAPRKILLAKSLRI